MKSCQGKKALTLGEFIMVAYDTWDKRRAGEIVRLAINTRLIEFRGRRRFVFSKWSLN
jgi:hypothetical protein